MKKLSLFLIISFLSVSAYAQSKSKTVTYEEKKSASRVYSGDMDFNPVYLELVVDDYTEKGIARGKLNFGNQYALSVKGQEEFKMMKLLNEEIEKSETIPDMLNILYAAGYELENFTTVNLKESVRHYFILKL